MISFRRLLGFGALSWLAPFLAAMALFPLRQSNRPLFDSLMGVVVALAAAALFGFYLRTFSGRYLAQGILAGAAWCAINLILDWPMFSWGPMRMTLAAYLSDIGAAYLAFPAVCIPMGWILERRCP